jgi:hypothetical protein
MLVYIFKVTLINIDISGIAKISLAIDAREGYEDVILFYNYKTGISESVPIWVAHRYCSISFITTVLVLLYLPLYQFCQKILFRVWGAIGDHS